MSGDASTLPLRPSAPERGGRLDGLLGRARVGAHEDAERGARLGAFALATIVALSLLIVLVAANRPSLLTPTSHPGYFPHWMAGPLGGLLQGFTNNGSVLKALFSGALVAMYCAYALICKRASRLPARWLIAAIAAAHAIFLLSPPLALTDLFNYVNYGRMEVIHGLNPYTTIPVLEPHDDPSFVLSNWHQLLSPYGPLFTILTFAVVPFGVAVSFWALKAVLMAASLAIVWMVWRCARLLGRDPRAAVALAGLNPVVLVWGLGGDHNDFLMIVCVVLGFYLLLLAAARASPPAPAVSLAGLLAALRAPGALLAPLSGLELTAGAAFAAAVAIKASAAVLVPVVLAGLARRPRAAAQTLLGMIAGAVVFGAATLLAFGPNFPDLSTQSSLVTGESVPNLVGLAIGVGGESAGVRLAMDVFLLASVLACCRLAWRSGEALTAAGWSSVALLMTLGWVLPWYVLWVLPFAALSRSRALRTAALVLGAYLIVAWAPVSGLLWKAISFRPEKTPLGRLHQRYVRELLD
ncbi:MAG TPA: hypothetical protein VL979_09955 [Solirubrobacteraceae bacterium]|nr:hypothetical protein [Solirubrobacteraceae bacterium]